MPSGVGIGLAVAGGLGAASSIYSGNKAANTQKDAAQAANDLLRPYVEGGYQGQNKLLELLGMGGFDEESYLAQNPDVAEAVRQGLFPSGQAHYEQFGQKENRQYQVNPQSALESLPGYQFTRDQGLKAIEASASARGLGGGSGRAIRGAADYVTGLADKTYGDQFNRLLGLTTLGQNAAVGAGTNLVGAGNAQGAAYMNTGNNLANMFTTGANAYGTNKILDMYAKSNGIE